MAGHIGIVACSPEGAALCYQTICQEGAELMKDHRYPEISLHNHSLGEYMDYIKRGEWKGVEKLMLSSARKLKTAGADFLICPDNTIHQVFDKVEPKSPLPWLHIAREVAKEAVRKGYAGWEAYRELGSLYFHKGRYSQSKRREYSPVRLSR